jgi:hypothetical protein
MTAAAAAAGCCIIVLHARQDAYGQPTLPCPGVSATSPPSPRMQSPTGASHSPFLHTAVGPGLVEV